MILRFHYVGQMNTSVLGSLGGPGLNVLLRRMREARSDHLQCPYVAVHTLRRKVFGKKFSMDP